jgi:transglutaminase-like putative cysteine protease
MPERRALAGRLPLLAVLIGFSLWHWERLEHPFPSHLQMLLLTVLAVVPPVVGVLTGRLRLAAALQVVLAVVAIGHVTGMWPWQTGHAVYPLRVWHDLYNGVSDWFSAVTPFDPRHFPPVDHVVRLSYVALVGAMAWFLLRGRALLAVAAAFTLYALPSTVLIMGDAVPRAVMFLGLTLLVLRSAAVRSAYPGGGGVSQALALGAAIVLAALVVGGAPGVTKAALFDWHSWNPLARQGPQVGVAYVWNDTYGPLNWPKKSTTLLEVYAPKPSYWRAEVLNTFALPSGRWVDTARPVALTESHGVLSVPDDVGPPVYTGTVAPGDAFNIRVVVEGLAGAQLITAGQPVLYLELPAGADAVANDDGTATAAQDLARGAFYDVHVYQANPSPHQLEQAGDSFPITVASSLDLGGVEMPVWGSGEPRPALPSDMVPFAAAADGVWQRSGAAGAANEYLAVALVERYLRSRPFVYELRPHYRSGVPVLVDFLDRSHRGYCQMFSAAMALVLRLHGIPARVAAGFETGTHRGANQPYVVTTRDAHTWVEAYFPGFGWLPFEPTPGASLPLQASTSSPAFARLTSSQVATHLTRQQQQALGLQGGNSPAGRGKISQLKASEKHLDGGNGSQDIGLGGPVAARSHSIGLFDWLVVAVGVVVACLLGLKVAIVRWRYLRRDPRSQAAAAYVEVATYVADQSVPVAAGATFEDIAADIARVYAVDAEPFARAASAARYGPLDRAEPAAADMRRELRALRRRLRRSLTWRERVAGSFRLRAAIALLGT